MDPTRRLATHTLTQWLVVDLRRVEGSITPVLIQMSYASSDPYALTISFSLHDDPMSWTFARNLLSGGLIEPTGDGDVHVWPCLDDDGFAVAAIDLCSAHTNALLEIDTTDVVEFVEHTYAIVAPGTESNHLDLDATITAIQAAENA